jgi:hypothetical protein
MEYRRGNQSGAHSREEGFEPFGGSLLSREESSLRERGSEQVREQGNNPSCWEELEVLEIESECFYVSFVAYSERDLLRKRTDTLGSALWAGLVESAVLCGEKG